MGQKKVQNHTSGNVQAIYMEQTEKKAQHQELYQDGAKEQNYQFDFSGIDEDEKQLRVPRSRAYMEVIQAVDMLSSTDEEILERLKETMDEDSVEEFAEMTDEEILEELKETIKGEFQNITFKEDKVLYGILAKCYIDGCDCHLIPADGNDFEHFEHFEINKPVPEKYRAARELFRKYKNCQCVEVYKNECRVIDKDATVITVPNHKI